MHSSNGRMIAATLTEEYVEDYSALIRQEAPNLDYEQLRGIGINFFTAFGHVPMHDRAQRRYYSQIIDVIDELLKEKKPAEESA